MFEVLVLLSALVVLHLACGRLRHKNTWARKVKDEPVHLVGKRIR